MKQKAICGGMCRGGDIRDMPVVQKAEKKEHSGKRALSSRESPTETCFLDCCFFVGLGITSVLSF